METNHFYNKSMASYNDYDDLMGNVEWEESELDSGYFDSDNEAGNPSSSWKWPTTTKLILDL